MPACEQPPCTPAPPLDLGTYYNPADYINNPFAGDGTDTNTNAVGTSSGSSSGTTINESLLGNVGGGVSTFGGMDASAACDVVLPVAPAIGVASSFIGLQQLSKIVKSIMGAIERVKENKVEFLWLSNESRELFNILVGQFQKAKDEELKGDITSTSTILGSLEIFCAEVAEQSRIDRAIHRKENKRKIALYKAKFRFARQALMFKSVIDVRRTVVDDLHPDMKELKSSINDLQKKVVASLRAQVEQELSEPKPTKPKHQRRTKPLPRLEQQHPPQLYRARYQVHYEDSEDDEYEELRERQQFYQTNRPHSWSSGLDQGSWASTSGTHYTSFNSHPPPLPPSFYSNHSTPALPAYPSQTSSYFDTNFLAPVGLPPPPRPLQPPPRSMFSSVRGPGVGPSVVMSSSSGSRTMTLANLHNSNNVSFY